MVKRLTLFVLLLGAVTTIGCMAWFGRAPDGGEGWFFLLRLAVGIISPYAIVAIFTVMFRRHTQANIVLLIAAVGLTASSVFLLLDSFVLHAGPQSGLIFLVLPILHLLALIPFVLIALVFEYRKRDSSGVGDDQAQPPGS